MINDTETGAFVGNYDVYDSFNVKLEAWESLSYDLIPIDT